MIQYKRNLAGIWPRPPRGKVMLWWDGKKYDHAIRILGNFYFVGVRFTM